MEKAALPYHAGHLEQVEKVLQDFLKWRPDGRWSELDTQELLDDSYPETLKDALVNELMDISGEFEKCYAQMCPFGVMDFDQIKKLQEQWDKLFDGCEVLPEDLLAEALECPTPLDVAQLLVPVPGGQFNELGLLI